MKQLRILYHFLGTFYFAILLIALTAAFVIAGTFFESLTHSHHFAEQAIYKNPFFSSSSGVFHRYPPSASRRWPFRWRHVPFLITHFGLLMILAGALLKSYLGMQSTMNILEGTASQRVFLANTHALHSKSMIPATLSAPSPTKSLFRETLIASNFLKRENLWGLESDCFKRLRTPPKSRKHGSKGPRASSPSFPLFTIRSEPVQIQIQGQTWNAVALNNHDRRSG